MEVPSSQIFHQKPDCISFLSMQLKNNTCIVIIVTDVIIVKVRRNSSKRGRFYIPAHDHRPEAGNAQPSLAREGVDEVDGWDD